MDIGVHQDGLVHISGALEELSYEPPWILYQLEIYVKVRVLEVDPKESVFPYQ